MAGESLGFPRRYFLELLLLNHLLRMKPCSKPIPLHQQEPKFCHLQTAVSTGPQREGSYRAHKEASHCTFSAHTAGITKVPPVVSEDFPVGKKKWTVSRCEQDVCSQPCLLCHLTRRKAACTCLLSAICLLLVQHTQWAQFAQNSWILCKELITKKG